MIQAMYVGSLTIIEAIAYVVVGCASVVGDVSIKRRILLHRFQIFSFEVMKGWRFSIVSFHHILEIFVQLVDIGMA